MSGEGLGRDALTNTVRLTIVVELLGSHARTWVTVAGVDVLRCGA
jgi:hypothetical protein